MFFIQLLLLTAQISIFCYEVKDITNQSLINWEIEKAFELTNTHGQKVWISKLAKSDAYQLSYQSHLTIDPDNLIAQAEESFNGREKLYNFARAQAEKNK